MKKPIHLCVPYLICMVVLLFLQSCKEPPKKEVPPLVPTIRVADAEALSERAFPGRARAGQEVNLSFRVTGPLIELPADVGDEFQAGDVVARMDPQDYLNALGTAKGSLQAAQATARKAAADYQRIQNVYREDPGATSQTAIDLTRAARDASRATVNSLTSAVKIAQDKVNYTSLKAPFSGVVVETYVENFETVLAKQPVLRLLDPTSIEFVISVPENLISYAPLVENVVVNFDALPGVDIPATIKEVGREASQATRTYPVTLVMAQPDDAEILPGMAGSARISARLPEDAKASGMQLPATAIFALEDPGKSYVWVIDETSKTLKSREVETGPLTEYGVTIRSGLSSGEWVVIKGVHSVHEGQTVRILDVSGEDAS
jgi:RND family efflux transporter MFP subunit